VEYKVLTKEDRRWSGKFSPENLERTLNSYAAECQGRSKSAPLAPVEKCPTRRVLAG
jgi:hypothetical protein